MASIKRVSGGTGTYIDNFVPLGGGGIAGSGGLAFGPDANLYVAIGAHAPGSGKVARYNGTTGGYIDDFVPNGQRRHQEAQDLVFGPDGNLYVCDGTSNSILRHNGATGA